MNRYDRNKTLTKYYGSLPGSKNPFIEGMRSIFDLSGSFSLDVKKKILDDEYYYQRLGKDIGNTWFFVGDCLEESMIEFSSKANVKKK